MSDTLDRARARLIVALDVPDRASALALAARLAGHVGMLKIGLELFVAEGPAIVRELRARHPELEVFLDLKLHDIPNTMVGAIRSVRGLGVRFVTVHAGSGVAHLRACVEAAGEGGAGQGQATGILAVTVLTSQDEQACREAGHTRSPAELVEFRARAAQEAGCAGLVCSGQELGSVVVAAPQLFKVIPGIRPAGSDVGDQKRVMTPALAIAAGATHLVVGRPIYTAEHPPSAADAIVAEIAGALESRR
jgi:orotidine-5'-phosphate decarboxylase